MESNISNITDNIFESIKHVDQNGNEYWYARELQVILGYTEWRKFNNVINKAKESCKNSLIDISVQIVGADNLYINVNGGKRKIQDYKLSRYACYLVAQNSDPRKKVVALAQTYFAIQTRKQELYELEFSELSEDEKRLYSRIQVRNKNKYLFKTASEAGVKNFGKFNNYGYKGLYNGETAKDIAKRKKISDDEDVLDYMGSEELGVNIFRITQTDAKLKRDKIKKEKDACETHFIVGKKVR